MGRIVVAAYRPHHPDRHEALAALVRDHVPILRKLGLATERAPIAMRAKDGTIVEVFEWSSKEAMDRAHAHPDVLAMWQRFEEVCAYVRFRDLAEASELFAELEALPL